jgi:guanylate kinase
MLVLIGASASGKTEIAKILIKDYNFKKMVTTTTRRKRKGEINKVDYNFITLNKFEKMKAENKFLETVQYNSNYYGTPTKGADIDKVLIVEPEGANSIYDKNIQDTVFFLLETDEETRKNRMLQRGDNLIQVLDRLHKDDKYFDSSNLKHIDYKINTSTLTQDDLAQIIRDFYYKHLDQTKSKEL